MCFVWGFFVLFVQGARKKKNPHHPMQCKCLPIGSSVDKNWHDFYIALPEFLCPSMQFYKANPLLTLIFACETLFSAHSRNPFPSMIRSNPCPGIQPKKSLTLGISLLVTAMWPSMRLSKMILFELSDISINKLISTVKLSQSNHLYDWICIQSIVLCFARFVPTSCDWRCRSWAFLCQTALHWARRSTSPQPYQTHCHHAAYRR